jgi:hypothetical protein
MICTWGNSYFLKTCGLMSACLINAFHNCRQDSGEPWDSRQLEVVTSIGIDIFTSSLCMTTKLPSRSP